MENGAIIGLIMAGSNIGGVWMLLQWYMKRIDATAQTTNEHSLLIERTAENQKATAETLARLAKDIEELYEHRNSHSKNLVEINTLHTLKGCNKEKGGSQ